RFGVDGLDQCAPSLRVAEEHHPNALVRELADAIGGKPEGVAKEREGVLDSRDRDRDVVQRAELHRRGGTYVPKTSRRSAQISPSVTSASTASTMSGTRFAVPLAAATRSARAFLARPSSRRARSSARRARWRSSTAGSTRVIGTSGSSPSA